MNKFTKNKKAASKAMPEGKEKSVKAEATDIINFTFFLEANTPENHIPTIRHYENILNQIPTTLKINLDENDLYAHTGAIKAVEDFANKYSLIIKNKKNQERWIALEGIVDNVEKALHIKLRKFFLDGNPYYFHNGEVPIPEELKGFVEGITGINHEPIKTQKVFPDEKALKKSLMRGLAVNPQDFARLYNFPKKLDGTGQCIGIISLGGGYDDACLQSYFDKINIPLPDISWTSVDGGKNNPRVNPMYDYEVYMDIEIAAALAPGAKIVVYFAKNTRADVIKSIKKAVYDTENKPSVISMSWGCLENEFTEIERLTLNHVLKEAAARSVTVLTSSGDLGSSGTNSGMGLNVQLPASNPYVLAVGGTEVHHEDGSIINEKVWQQTLTVMTKSTTAASGGGFSKYWGIPGYQLNSILKEDYKQAKRGIPDVAANASTYPGIFIQVHESEQISLGTSAATPLWAALIARINQYLASLGLPTAGFINPFIYQNELSHAFNQITEGSNGAYLADPGWDPCTGLGTPNGDVLMRKIAAMKKQSQRK